MFSEQFSIQDLIDNGLIIAHKDGNYGSNYPKKSEFNDHGVLFLTAKNLDDSGNIDFSSAQRLNVEKAKELTFGYIESGDVLLSHNATVGRVALVPDLDEPVLIGTSLTYFRINDNELNPRYFAGFLSSRDFQNQLKAVMSFSTRNQVPITLQRTLNVSLPALDEQKKMSDFISSFEHKLELNQKMNKTLEEIAKTLFKSWFIDFDPVRAKAEGRPTGLSKEISDLFPDSFEDSELGEIPKGWKIELFKNVVDEYVDNRGKTPPLVDIGIPLVEVKHMHDNSQFPDLNTDKHVSKDIFDSWFRKHVEKYDVLISTVGTIGLTTCVFNSNFAIAQNVLGLRFPTKSMSLYMFNLIKSNYFQHQMNSRLVETVQKSIKRKDLNEIPNLVPSEEILIEFFNFASANLEKQFNNELQNATLSNLRDMLLPELISGQLTIPDAENLIEEAGI